MYVEKELVVLDSMSLHVRTLMVKKMIHEVKKNVNI